METAKPEKFTVLVEEEVLIRRLWTDYYRENNWPLEVFENPLEFLSQLDRFKNRPEKVYFFFDQDFGKVRGVGTELARAVKGLNARQTVSLVTFYDEYVFQKEIRQGLVQYVFEKYPRWIFGGGDFVGNRLQKNPELLGLLGEESGAAERALGAYEDLEFSLEKHFPSLASKSKPVVIKTSVVASSITPAPVKTPWWKRLILSPSYT